MRNPNELKVYELAMDLAVTVYELTAAFPSEERFGLVSQMRRAAVSIASNIAEGCSRESQADFRRFVEIATGSAMELRCQLTLAVRLGFVRQTTNANDIDGLVRALTALSKTLRAGT